MKIVLLLLITCFCVSCGYHQKQEVFAGEVWEYCYTKNPFDSGKCDENLVIEVRKNSDERYWVKFEKLSGWSKGSIMTEPQSWFLVGSKRKSR